MLLFNVTKFACKFRLRKHLDGSHLGTHCALHEMAANLRGAPLPNGCHQDVTVRFCVYFSLAMIFLLSALNFSKWERRFIGPALTCNDKTGLSCHQSTAPVLELF